MERLINTRDRLISIYTKRIGRYNKITRSIFISYFIGILWAFFASWLSSHAKLSFLVSSSLFSLAFLPSLLHYSYFFLRKKLTSWPWVIASYINQQYLFHSCYSTKRPFVVVLRSFK